jgi:hypothetical protein
MSPNALPPQRERRKNRAEDLALCWQDQTVAMTGRLASMNRSTARAMIVRLGGIPVQRVSRNTRVLIIGGDGWPLRRGGRPTKNLQRAGLLQRRGVPIEIITEAAFLRRLNLSEEDNVVQRLYTIEQISSMVKISGLRLRRWVDAGLIRPETVCEGIALFRFGQVASIRDLWRLISAGCDPRQLRRSLSRLARWSSEADQAIVDLQRFGRALVTRASDGGLIDGDGQRLLHFEDDSDPPPLAWRVAERTEDPQAAFEHAMSLENEPAEAIAAYEDWLNHFGADAAVYFNLANLLTAAGTPENALSHYQQAARMQPDNACVWNNFGLALADLGRLDEASAMLARAVRCDPEYADAYYNAADVHDLRGQGAKARLMWLRYLSLEPEGEYASFARGRCGQQLALVTDASR